MIVQLQLYFMLLLFQIMFKMSGLPCIRRGASFISYDQFVAALRAYEEKTNTVYVTHDCKKKKNDNVLRYSAILKVCKHFGSKRNNPNNKKIRVNQRYVIFLYACVNRTMQD